MGKFTSSQISKNRRKAIAGGAVATVGGAVGLYALNNMGSGKSSSSSSGSSSTGGTGTGTDGDGGTGTGTDGDGGSSDGKTVTKKQVVEIPIDNYDDALKFALNEWHKIRRDDGRQVECKVVGDISWYQGEWSKVLLPSFDINEYMYITRVSHSNGGGEWEANITLVDYPPGWGEENLEEQVSNDEESTDDTSDTDTDTDEDKDTDTDTDNETTDD